MNKIFRKIRQNMINQNKTGKYLKYAIGEIILVVIGILIAIQANNWNVKRNIKTDLNHSLGKLLVEINQDLIELNNDIKLNNNIAKALDSCLIILKEPEKYSINKFDSLFHYTNLTMSFEFTKVTFDEISNSGKLKQFSNRKLSDSLINYYGYIRYKQVEEALAYHVRNNIRNYTLGFDYLNFNDELDPYLTSDFRISKKTLLDYSSDVRIINSIRLKILLHNIIDEHYNAILAKTEYLIKKIEEELNK